MSRCAPWSSRRPGARCARRIGTTRSRVPARCSSRSVRAASAGQTCTCATGSCAGRDCRVVPATGSSGACSPRARTRATPARASASRGWAGPTGLPLLHERAGEPLRARAVHGDGPRRRLRRARRGRRTLRLPPPRRLRGPRSRAAAVRRAHRPSRPAHDRRRAAPRPLRLRGARAHRLPGRASTRGARSTPSPAPATRRRRPSPSSSAARGPGDALGPARAARRGDHLRPGRVSSSRRRCARPTAAGSWSGRAST